MAGRPRKPTALLELSGAFKHDPQRKRPGEPKELRPLGDPPARLSLEAVPYWHELADMAGATLTWRDRWAVELAAGLMARATSSVSAEKAFEITREWAGDSDALKGVAKISIEVTYPRDCITPAEWSVLTKLLSGMGMDPASRSKLSIPATNEKPANRFAALASEIKAQRPN